MFLKFKQKIQEIIRITHLFFITILKGIQLKIGATGGIPGGKTMDAP